jgi:hypothetical protein
MQHFLLTDKHNTIPLNLHAFCLEGKTMYNIGHLN